MSATVDVLPKRKKQRIDEPETKESMLPERVRWQMEYKRILDIIKKSDPEFRELQNSCRNIEMEARQLERKIDETREKLMSDNHNSAQARGIGIESVDQLGQSIADKKSHLLELRLEYYQTKIAYNKSVKLRNKYVEDNLRDVAARMTAESLGYS